MRKANVSVGYLRGGGMDSYKVKEFANLDGADIKIMDGLGNTIEVNVRAGGQGYSISLNSKTLKRGYKYG